MTQEDIPGEVCMTGTSEGGKKSLKSLVSYGGSGDIPVKAFMANNLGSPTLLLQLALYDFYRMSDVANDRSKDGEAVTQRKLDPAHARKLGQYILKGLLEAVHQLRKHEGRPAQATLKQMQDTLGRQPYLSLQPIVANLRTAGASGEHLRADPILADGNKENLGVRIWLGQKDLLWVVDGQHRRKGMDAVIEFLEEIRTKQIYPPKKQSLFPHERDDRTVPADEMAVWTECYEVARGACTVNVEVHLGLDIDEERQLFHDLNNLGKKVETSLALEFDSANPVNAFIKEELITRGIVRITQIDKPDWNEDDGGLARKELVSVNAHLFLNKSNINGATPPKVTPAIPIAKRFWESVSQIDGFGESQAKTKTVAAQPVVLKALAKLTYDFSFGRQRNAQHLETLLDRVTDLDFSHDNPMWRYYEMTEEERQQTGLAGLDAYLPDNSSGNRDIGGFDRANGWMRFGSKHNDIFPIIGDMIRWRLQLPSRHEARESAD